MKRLLCTLCAAVLALTLTQAVASAAAQAVPAPEPSDFSVNVVEGNIQFVRNGVVKEAYEAKPPVDIRVSTGKDRELLIVFTQPDGKQKTITLEAQKNLVLSGRMGNLQLDRSLSPSMSVTIAPTAVLDRLTVRSRSQVFVGGSAGTVIVASAAKLSVGEGATVNTLRVTSARAAVQASPGSVVKKAYSVKRAAVSGVGSVTTLSSPSPQESLEGSPPSSGGAPSALSPAPAPEPSDVRIVNVYPTAQNVRVEFSGAVKLDASAFYIRCRAGKDMTILRVDTASGAESDSVYNLRTAHYADNSYVLEVALPGGKLLAQGFATHSQLPDASGFRAERLSADTAQFSFVCDMAGTVYYVAVEGSLSRGAVGAAIPQSAQEIKQKGASRAVVGGENIIQITGLSAGRPYTVYCVLADTQGAALSGMLPPLAVPAEPPANPDAGDIVIERIEQIENRGFRIVLSRPTAQKLDLGAFYAKCPAQSALHLGRAQTTDNRVYEVYLQDGWFYMSKNHYEVKVTFPDGTAATGTFYAGSYPAIGLIEGKRYTDGSVVVTFNSDKPGKIYYGTVPTPADKPADVSWVLANATQGTLFAGKNELPVGNVPANHQQFYMVAVDDWGNMPAFVDGGEITNVSTPPPGGGAGNAILSITASSAGSVAGPVTALKVIFKEAVAFTNITDTNTEFIALEGGANSPPRIIQVSGGMNTMTSSEITLSLNLLIPDGSRYKLAITLDDGSTVSGEFTVGQSRRLTIGASS